MSNSIANSSATVEPETRNSFLVSLVDDPKSVAWDDFNDIYGPIIFGFAKRQGLQEADAQEVLQDVLLQVYKYLPSFQYDRDRGRFRGWLHTVTLNRIKQFWKKNKKRCEYSGNNSFLDMQAANDMFGSALVRQLVAQALSEVRDSFQDDTWSAFQMTWMNQVSVEETAKTLSRPIGWVYVAKSRVLKKLTKRVASKFEELG